VGDRIHVDLAPLGWREPHAEAFAALGDDALRPARVLAVDRGRLLLHDGERERESAIRGRLHREGLEPVTGDWVAIDGDGAAAAVLDRGAVLARATESGPPQILLANVDRVLVAHAVEDPQRHRVVRFLALAGEAGVPGTVLLTKVDKVPDPAAELDALAAVAGAGVDVVPTSAKQRVNLEEVVARVPPATTTALVGVSGAGKSTLINALLGEERQATGAVRERDGRGRHVTVRRELVPLPGAGWLVDTPGLRLVRVRGDIREAFEDVWELAAQCRFSDCTHTTEPGCAVREAIEAGELHPARAEAAAALEAEAAEASEREARRRR
jgi:ribosome biogenesis GTPase